MSFLSVIQINFLLTHHYTRLLFATIHSSYEKFPSTDSIELQILVFKNSCGITNESNAWGVVWMRTRMGISEFDWIFHHQRTERVQTSPIRSLFSINFISIHWYSSLFAQVFLGIFFLRTTQSHSIISISLAVDG